MDTLLFSGDGSDPNFFYHCGLSIDNSFLLMSGGRRTMFVSRMNESAARASFKGKVVVYKDPFDAISPYVKGKTIGVDSIRLSMRMARRLRRFGRLADRSEELSRLRMRKRPDEVRAIRKAVRETKGMLEELDLRAAKTELDLRRQLMVMMAKRGLEQAFEPIVSTGRNTAFPHHSATRKRLESLVMIDIGVKNGRYCSDLTRCFLLRSDKEKERQYESLQGICHSIVDEMPSLRDGRELSAFAERLVERAGFPRMIHSIGHGVGLEVHEKPDLSPKSKDSISGAAMAIEPAFYLERYGMRFEETIFHDGKKARIL